MRYGAEFDRIIGAGKRCPDCDGGGTLAGFQMDLIRDGRWVSDREIRDNRSQKCVVMCRRCGGKGRVK